MHKDSFWRNLSILRLLLILLFIFSLKFSAIPVNSNRLVIVFLITGFIFLESDKKLFYSRSIPVVLFPAIIFLVYSFTMFVLTGMQSLDIFANTLIIVFQSMFGAYLIVLLCFNKSYSFDQLLFDIFVILGIQGVFILLNFMSFPIREFLYIIIPPAQESNISATDIQSLYRVRGLTQGTGAKVSAFLSIGLLISAYFFSITDLCKHDRRIIIICLPFILIGILFTGRTGLLAIPLAFLMYYWILIVKGRLTIKSIYPLILTPFVAGILYYIFKESYYIAMDGGLTLPNGEDLFARWERWAFSEFTAYFSGEEKQISTGSLLTEHIIFPQDTQTWLIGDPATWSRDRVSSDIGYIRILFSSGIIGGILYYSIFILTFYVISRNLKKQVQRFFLYFLLLWLLIIEAKEPMFNYLYFSNLIMLFLFVSVKYRITTGKNAE